MIAFFYFFPKSFKKAICTAIITFIMD